MKQEDTVVICTLNILVAGTVWTLEYDGTAINTSAGGGFKIFGDESEFSRVYTPPTEPGTSTPTKDPIVAVYTPNKSAADDLVTSGSH